MANSVCLSKDLIDQARIVSQLEHRSMARQIEHWAQLGIEHENTSCCMYAHEKDYAKYHTPNAETIEAIKDCENGIGMIAVESTEELMRQLNAD
jgi:hypothetical protein